MNLPKHPAGWPVSPTFHLGELRPERSRNLPVRSHSWQEERVRLLSPKCIPIHQCLHLLLKPQNEPNLMNEISPEELALLLVNFKYQLPQHRTRNSRKDLGLLLSTNSP